VVDHGGQLLRSRSLRCSHVIPVLRPQESHIHTCGMSTGMCRVVQATGTYGPRPITMSTKTTTVTKTGCSGETFVGSEDRCRR
jgi:hypothetical protein